MTGLIPGGHSPRSIHAHEVDESAPWAGSVETVYRDTRAAIPFQDARHTQRTGTLPVYAQSPTSQAKLDDMIFRSSRWNFEEQVELWSDFNQADYHPRSLLENPSHFASDSTFDVFSYGFANSDHLEEYLDTFRYFTEACNRPQGVQVLLDTDSGYGALAQQLLTDIADDFGLPLTITALSPFSSHATPKVFSFNSQESAQQLAVFGPPDRPCAVLHTYILPKLGECQLSLISSQLPAPLSRFCGHCIRFTHITLALAEQSRCLPPHVWSPSCRRTAQQPFVVLSQPAP